MRAEHAGRHGRQIARQTRGRRVDHQIEAPHALEFPVSACRYRAIRSQLHCQRLCFLDMTIRHHQLCGARAESNARGRAAGTSNTLARERRVKIHLDITQQANAVEVVCEIRPPSNLNAFAAPASVARSLRSSAMSNAASLNGAVMFMPLPPAAINSAPLPRTRHPVRTAPRWPCSASPAASLRRKPMNQRGFRMADRIADHRIGIAHRRLTCRTARHRFASHRSRRA